MLFFYKLQRRCTLDVMSEITHNSYPGMPIYDALAEQLRQLAEAGSVALAGLRAVIGHKKEDSITDEDRATAERARQQIGKDYIPPRGRETGQSEGGEIPGRTTSHDPNATPEED